MIRYTARNGTTFQFDPAATPGRVNVITTADDEAGDPIAIDLDDLREFLQHLEERLDAMCDLPPDADYAAVGPD